MFMWTGARLSDGDITPEEFYNITDNVRYDDIKDKLNFTGEGENVNNTFIIRSIYKYGDFLGFIAVEGMAEAMNFGYENPEYNFNFAWRLMFVCMFAILIIPLIYVLLFIGYGIYNIVQWVRSKHEAKHKARKQTS